LVEFGAEVVVINAEPDGLNINVQCGSTHLEPLRRAVATHLADLGVAHDGDGDRALFVDETGQVRNGDYLLTLCGLHLKKQGRLAGDLLVTTVLGNTGLDLTLNPLGIRIVRSPVGDRFVWEKMREVGASLGGEQAGHIIFSEFAHTGDGLLTTLQVLAAMLDSGKPLSELASVLTVLPQATRDIRVPEKPPLEDFPRIAAAVAEVEQALNGRGRIVVRYSGTEPLARVMIEGEDRERIEELAEGVAQVIREVLGGE
jgi:phosphoglucosamine mutase